MVSKESLVSLRAKLRGVSAIPVTPFDRSLEVDYGMLAEVVGRIAKSGVDVVIACGNTSEYSSLSADEIDGIIEQTVGNSRGIPTLVGVGGDLPSAVRRIARGISAGADGVMIHSPVHSYISNDGLTNYYRALADATDGGVVLYVRGREIPPEVLEKLVGLDNILAIKYARRDLPGFARLVERFGDSIEPLCGLAEAWAPYFWFAGARGFTSGLANVEPRLATGLCRALRDDDLMEAHRLWSLIKPFEDLRAEQSDGLNVPVVKQAMRLRGLIPDAAVRPPISELSPTDRARLASIMDTWDLAL